MECERKIKPKITREIFTAFCLSSLHLSRQGGEEREKKKAMENQPLIVTMEIVFFRFYSSHHSTLFTRPTPNQFRWFMNKQFLDFSFSLVPPFLRTTSRLAFVDGNQTCRCRKAAWIRRGALEKPNNWIYYKLEIYILIWLALISAPIPDRQLMVLEWENNRIDSFSLEMIYFHLLFASSRTFAHSICSWFRRPAAGSATVPIHTAWHLSV